ncbi:hypothetical protein ACYSNR_00960 [Enterococcus sp. LJL128]
MAKSRRKKKKQQKLALSSQRQEKLASDFMGSDSTYEILETLIKDSPDDCASGYDQQKKKGTPDLLDWLWENMPVLEYVVSSITSMIFSAPITTGEGDEADEKVKAFLYAQNAQGTTNYLLLREAVKRALVFGRTGIRYLSDEAGLQMIKYNHFGNLIAENTEYYGFDDTLAYIISRNQKKLDFSSIKKDELTGWFDFDMKELFKKGILITKDKRHIGVPVEDFVNLRTDVSSMKGESILTRDRLRNTLITSIYEHLIDDLEYDGPGRILLWLKGAGDFSDGNEASTSNVLKNTVQANAQKADKAKREAVKFGEQLKNSTSKNVAVVNNMFDKLDTIPRVTKSTEFLTFAETAGEIVAQIFGIHPALIGLGKMNGNISMEKILDNAMENVIIPYRELFAVQLSNMLAPKLEVEKIYFYKDDTIDYNAKTDNALKTVELAERLSNLGFEDKAKELIDNIAI